MRVASLRLRDFRNYPRLDIAFGKGVNLIHGPNGSGKTNILEAVYALSVGRSFRTDSDLPLIAYGKKEAYAEARVLRGSGSYRVASCFSKEGKKVTVDGKPLRKLSSLIGRLNALLFYPEDVGLFLGSPSARRSFLDLCISREDKDYLKALSDYGKLLKDRNALLKEEEPDLAAIEAVTQRLIAVSAPVERKRSAYLSGLSEAIGTTSSALYGEDKRALLLYKPFVDEGHDYGEAAGNYYRQSLESDLRYGATQGGIHREDFRMLLNGKDIGLYGSQGENRMGALALKLAPYELLRGSENEPVVLLDDVLSELDAAHRDRLFGLLRSYEQTIITSAEDIPAEDINRIDTNTIRMEDK